MAQHWASLSLQSPDARQFELGHARFGYLPRPTVEGVSKAGDCRSQADGDTDSAAARACRRSVEEKKALSPRRAYGLALKALGAANPRIVALDGDVKNSTYAEDFAKAYPDRYFEGRIAEQNMVSAGAGLAAGGKIAFVSTFGRFLERALDEIEMAVISVAIKLVGRRRPRVLLVHNRHRRKLMFALSVEGPFLFFGAVPSAAGSPCRRTHRYC